MAKPQWRHDRCLEATSQAATRVTTIAGHWSKPSTSMTRLEQPPCLMADVRPSSPPWPPWRTPLRRGDVLARITRHIHLVTYTTLPFGSAEGQNFCHSSGEADHVMGTLPVQAAFLVGEPIRRSSNPGLSPFGCSAFSSCVFLSESCPLSAMRSIFERLHFGNISVCSSITWCSM